MSPQAQLMRDALLRDGFVRCGPVLNQKQCLQFSELSVAHYNNQLVEEKRARLSPGSLIRCWQDEAFAEVIAWESVLHLLRDVGFRMPYFSNGYVVTKPPQTPPTFWHQDWWGWDDAASYDAAPLQVGALVYLEDTSAHNGCLRVIPGSHRRRHALHHQLTESDVLAMRRADDLRLPEFHAADGEQDVEVKAGELVLIDARVLHSTHANQSSQHRSALLSWYLLDFSNWSPALRSCLPDVEVPPHWSAHNRAKIQQALPPSNGSKRASPVLYGLVPDARLGST